MKNKNFLSKVSSVALSGAVLAISLLSFSSSAAPVVAASPKLEITNQVDKNQADRGDVLSYTITVKNSGDVATDNTLVWLNALNLASYVNGSGNYIFTPTPNVTRSFPDNWVTTGANFDTMQPGEMVTIHYQTKVAENANMNDVIWSVASVRSNQTAQVTASSWTRLYLKNALLCAEKTADKSTVSAGDVVTFTIKICNKGNITLDNVVVGDIIESPFRYVAGSGELKINSQVTKIDDKWLQNSFRIAYLNPGMEAFLTYKVTVSNEMTDGQTLQNVAQVKSDQTPNWVKCAVFLKAKVLGVSTNVPSTPTQLPNTGPGEVLLLVASLVPAGLVLKRFKNKI